MARVSRSSMRAISLLYCVDLLLILGDGDGHRTAGRSDRIGAVAYLLAQNDQRVAVGDFLCGFVGVTPHERK